MIFFSASSRDFIVGNNETTLSAEDNKGFLVIISDDIILEDDETFLLTLVTSEPSIIFLQRGGKTMIEILNDDGKQCFCMSHGAAVPGIGNYHDRGSQA